MSGIDAVQWLARWDRQQEGYIPSRDRRFGTMFDVLAAQLPPEFVALDLGCGPGSLSARLLDRFPGARVEAVDFDPVLIHLGQNALAGRRERMRWVETDLRDPAWRRRLQAERFDAVLSTTALHWLDEPTLRRLYQDLSEVVRPGGVVMNGDHLAYPTDRPTIAGIADRVQERQRAEARGRPEFEDWESWWSHLEHEPTLAALFAERRRRFPAHHGDEPALTLEAHASALRAAGFAEVDVVWQEFDDRVLLAVR